MKTPIPQFIGTRVRRREDPLLITGGGKYVADVPLPGAAHVVLVRSPYAHARLRGLSLEQARRREGVLLAWTAEDVRPLLKAPLPVMTGAMAGEFRNLRNPDRYPLSSGRVRYVGDPVALVAAENAYQATDAVDSVEVDYEPLPASCDPEQTLGPKAERLYEEWEDNRAFTWSLEAGNVEEAFESSEVSVELRARIQRLIPNAMEPRAVAASFDPSTSRFTVWSSTQFPHLLRDHLAEILGVEASRIRVVAPEVGGGFGAKCNVYPEEILLPLLARELSRPVRWTATRSEDFVATTQGRGQVDVLRLAADAQGKVRGLRLEVLADCGACYGRATPVVASLTGVMAPGVYEIPNLRVEVTGVFTNKPPVEPYRGAGRPEAAYLIERGMDLLAARLRMDPAELRRRNFIPPERFPYRTATGLEYDSGEYGRALEEALERADYAGLRREQKRRRQEGGSLLGIGLSCYVEICGFGPWEAGTVGVGPDGKVVVLTGTSPHGQGHQTSWAQVAGQILQIPMEEIEVRHGDTDVVPAGIGTFGSRSAPVGGSAVLKSARTVVEGAREIAAHLLEAPVEEIVLEEGRFQVTGVPGRALSWREIAETAHRPELPAHLQGKLRAETRFEPSGETYPFGTHLCVVEVDPETGGVRIVRYVSVDDCGKVINPLLVEGQIHGGLAQGIGQALFEEAHFDEDGNLLSGSFMDYALPRAHMLPDFQTGRTETPTPLNELGVKGVGEAATIGSTPAVVNAVVDALSHLGVRHLDTPLTPERVWRAIHGS